MFESLQHSWLQENSAKSRLGRKTNTVHVWIPGLFSVKGGIQTFSRHFVEALCQQEPLLGGRILIKNDIPGDVDRAAIPLPIDVVGHWPAALKTARFGYECMFRSWQEKPDLIISTHLHFGPLAWAIQQALGTPYVLVAHGIEAWQVHKKLRRKALQQANLVLAVSQYTREWLIREVELEPDRVRLLPNTFSSERIPLTTKSPQLLSKYKLTEKHAVIMTVCRLADAERYKGYDHIIRALPQILREVPDTRYLLVGEGPDRPRIERLIAEVGVQDSVILAGFVPDEELVEHYNLCDLFAMPSKAEGFGIVYLEALAVGKPVLAGNKDGSRDALANGELGLLIDPEDINELARESIKVLRREHSHPNIFRPDFLQQRVTELFGFEAFQKTIVEHLKPFLTSYN